MSGKERRIAPRKDCAVPLRFRILSSSGAAERLESNVETNPRFTRSRGILEGESVNLSERGIYFRSREHVTIGSPIEIYFRLPRELTGRTAEEVRCSARVVHVDHGGDGLSGIGATVERYEPIASIRNWHN